MHRACNIAYSMSRNVCQYHCLRSFHDFAQVGSRCQRFPLQNRPWAAQCCEKRLHAPKSHVWLMACASHMNSWFVPCPNPPWPIRSGAYGIREKSATSQLPTWTGNVAIRAHFWAIFLGKEMDHHGIRFPLGLSKSLYSLDFSCLLWIWICKKMVLVSARGFNDIL